MSRSIFRSKNFVHLLIKEKHRSILIITCNLQNLRSTLTVDPGVVLLTHTINLQKWKFFYQQYIHLVSFKKSKNLRSALCAFKPSWSALSAKGPSCSYLHCELRYKPCTCVQSHVALELCCGGTTLRCRALAHGLQWPAFARLSSAA
jgi:hypothetical protein